MPLTNNRGRGYLPVGSLRSEMMRDGPAALWPMKESSGSTVYDVSGNGRHLPLTLGTPGWRTAGAVPGHATVGFPGATGFGSAFSGFGDISAFTIEAWSLATARNGAGDQYIEQIVGNEANGTKGVVMRNGNGGVPGNTGEPEVYAYNGSTYQEAIGGSALALNTSYHYAGRWDGTTLTLYVNGVVTATIGLTGTTSFDTVGSGLFAIGYAKANALSANRQWWGTIGFVGIYTRDIGAGRVLDHYFAGLRDGRTAGAT